jgi:hypothetical protein
MSPYNALYPKGTECRIAPLPRLEEFRRTWKYHHKLAPEQLQYAGVAAVVRQASYYHGGDVLYLLLGINGYWHEECLEPL